MTGHNALDYISNVLKNTPSDWLTLTTHRLDIYDEERAKTAFTEQFDALYQNNRYDTSALEKLPTAFDYIRLGHPLSCVLEWAIAVQNDLSPQQVISFSSRTMPILAVLRKNRFENKHTRILYRKALPASFNGDDIKRVYGYHFDLMQIDRIDEVSSYDGSTIFISQDNDLSNVERHPNVDFVVHTHPDFGSIILVNGEHNNDYISDIQHIRRRESIAMTPANCFAALSMMVGNPVSASPTSDRRGNQDRVVTVVQSVTGTSTKALLGSSGLSIQYAIMMGLVNHAKTNHQGKDIRFVVPPNCYGGTNDQARRVAAAVDGVSVMDLPVDGDNDMVESIDAVLKTIANDDAIPYIIAEIPTNPRVEVPNLNKLREVLSKHRHTPDGKAAVDPVFILDQTFCPNVQFLGENQILSSVRTISYVSGSKFPSGGKCTAGYCVANDKAEDLLESIEHHLTLCDNAATDLQVRILAEQLPSMNQRIIDAYKNTREFVNFIEEVLPEAKINFVSEELAESGFMPSVFSLDLPTKGDTAEEREQYKRALNQTLIYMMIGEIPHESKYCVSYGQLKGCYWTIPATSTQGTTKEEDKDYIARVSLSPDLDLDKHKKVFKAFTQQIND